MTSNISNTRATRWLNEIRDACWLSLHFDDPELAGNYASEFSGGAYIRVRAYFTEVASRTIWLAEPAAWNGLPQGRISHIGGWDAIRNGDPHFFGKMPSPYNVLAGKGLQLLPGEVVVSL